MRVSSQFQNGQDKLFNAFFDTVAIFTWLSWRKNSKKKYRCNTKNMQHFLQPR